MHGANIRITSSQLNFILNQKSQQDLTILYIKTICIHACLPFLYSLFLTDGINKQLRCITWKHIMTVTVCLYGCPCSQRKQNLKILF